VVAERKVVTCPKCQKETKGECAAALPLNTTLLKMVQAASETMTALRSPDAVLCNNCQASTATLHCPMSCGDLCEPCSSQLHSMRALAGHVSSIVPLEQKPEPIQYCAEHPEEVRKIYCVPCRSLICMFCKEFGLHHNHPIKLISQVAEENKHQLTSLCAAVASLGSPLLQAEHKLRNEKRKLKSEARQLKHQIREHTDQLVAAIKHRSALLQKQLEMVVAERKDACDKRMESITDWLCKMSKIHVEVNDLLSKNECHFIEHNQPLMESLASMENAFPSLSNTPHLVLLSQLQPLKLIEAVSQWGSIDCQEEFFKIMPISEQCEAKEQKLVGGPALMASNDKFMTLAYPSSGYVHIMETQQFKLVSCFIYKELRSLAMGSNFVALGDVRGNVVLFDMKGAVMQQLDELHEGCVTSLLVCRSLTSEWLVSGGEDGYVRVYSRAGSVFNYQEICRPLGQPVSSMASAGEGVVIRYGSQVSWLTWSSKYSYGDAGCLQSLSSSTTSTATSFSPSPTPSPSPSPSPDDISRLPLVSLPQERFAYALTPNLIQISVWDHHSINIQKLRTIEVTGTLLPVSRKNMLLTYNDRVITCYNAVTGHIQRHIYCPWPLKKMHVEAVTLSNGRLVLHLEVETGASLVVFSN